MRPPDTKILNWLRLIIIKTPAKFRPELVSSFREKVERTEFSDRYREI